MSEIDLKEIGKRIQARRKQQGFTQEQIAELMNVSVQMISNLERGNKSIRIENLINLCKILNVSTDYILIGSRDSAEAHEGDKRLSRLSDKEKELIEMIIDFCASE
ncbi:MAG: helix-turn-helix transcriptional regulator [Clostridia bacterium]|nr:helix-turn-helix transcriptional regulator [Clostridia bacterium]